MSENGNNIRILIVEKKCKFLRTWRSKLRFHGKLYVNVHVTKT